MRSLRQKVNKTHGPAYITGQNRNEFAPFALFDAGRTGQKEPLIIDWHPHSGIATITFPFDADLHHVDSAGNNGIIKSYGLQWMASGKGIWHKESYYSNLIDSLVEAPAASQIPPDIGIMQLWLLLPPAEEVAEVCYFNLQPEQIPSLSKAGQTTRVLLGSYRTEEGESIQAAASISHNASYLDVQLSAGEQWSFQPPAGQSRGFVYPYLGEAGHNLVAIDGDGIGLEQVGLLIESNDSVVIQALQDCRFVIALTEPWPHPIVQHYGQIHTHKEALVSAGSHIQQLAIQLESQLSQQLIEEKEAKESL